MRKPAIVVALFTLMLGAAACVRADGDAIAIINGRPLSEQTMNRVLREAYGLQVLQQLIALELAKDETSKRGLRVSQADVEREFERALARIAPEVNPDGVAVTESEQRQSLDFMLQQKGISLTEFMLGMERNAHLRKVVEREFKVDEATLREEFARTYGEKVEVRHVQVENVNALHETLRLIEQGTDFAEIARRVSQNAESAARGGLLPPFTFDDDSVHVLLREVAFALEEGGVSKPVKVGVWWHVLKLERRVRPAAARFEDVRDDVLEKLRDRVIPERMNLLVTELFRRAQVRVLDRDLRVAYEEMLKKNEEEAARQR